MTHFSNLNIPTNFITSPHTITFIETKAKAVELEYGCLSILSGCYGAGIYIYL